MDEFNINEYVWVRLTDLGRDIHARNWRELQWRYELLGVKAWGKYEGVKEVDGWSQWQMWELMREFGKHLGNGFPNPFETTIRLVAP